MAQKGYTDPKNKKRHLPVTGKCLNLLVRLERFERPTYGFVVRCSIQLSYKRIGIGFIAYNTNYFNLFLLITLISLILSYPIEAFSDILTC